MANLWDKLISFRERIHLRLFLVDSEEPSEEEIAYFAANPDQIDEVSEPMRLHRLVRGDLGLHDCRPGEVPRDS